MMRDGGEEKKEKTRKAISKLPALHANVQNADEQ